MRESPPLGSMILLRALGQSKSHANSISTLEGLFPWFEHLSNDCLWFVLEKAILELIDSILVG